MKKAFLSFVVGIFAGFYALSAAATVLTFDDLNTGGAGAVAPAYGDLTLNGWWHIDTPPYGYPAASAPTILYNSESAYTNTPEILFASTVDVLSVYLADFSSGTVTLHGYLGTTLLHSLTVDPVAGVMTKFMLGFTGIDKFVMETTQGRTYAFMDNLEYGASVPEPASLMLMGFALAALGAARRKSV